MTHRFERNGLDVHLEADVIVIGAGIAGAGVAAELSTSHQVVLLEQEAQPGYHATGRSAALHSEVYGNASIRALTRSSRDFFLAGADGQDFAHPRGCVHIARADQLDALEAFAGQPTVGPFVSRVSGDVLRERIPLLKPGHVVAALEERCAFDLDVAAIHQHFLRRHRANGGSLHCSSGVEAIERANGDWLVAASGRSFRAPILVNAAGAWGDRIAAVAGICPVGLQPKRRSALTVDAPAGVDPSRWPAAIDIAEQFYFKPEGGRILISPADETPSEPCDASPEELDLAIAVDRVQQALDLPVRRITHSWAGLRTFVADKTPVVGFASDAPGFFWLVGQGGYGIQTSPALSRLAAELISGRSVPADLQDQGIDASDLSPARLRAEVLS
ncbi:FAD-dependent oxidoreductase [Sphingomonas histidinilytica]|uniref:D-arginine dehydrogenase n=1 Tax=Rhizorhabdus histidinilytica TaxID=439228 RepID=A0A1T5CZ15_9SPHN|nr:FAD-dependent oxidoreductase [Rhizorhabdus histidinilytica]SKB64581.1 D-arginine dehydrogenase [Rhizorhabdus histidinilytica]